MDSKGVEGTGVGLDGIAACEGADRLHEEQLSLVVLISSVRPGQNTIALARDSKADSSITSKPTADLMKAMKTLAVVAVATGVIRAELVQMKQDRGETFRTFAARVRGKAETCSYTTKCSCNSTVNFTDIIVRDVLIAGISDLDICRDILGTDAILQRPVNNVISLVESKEMACNALPTSLPTVSSFKREKQHFPPTQHAATNRQQTAQCPKCSDTYNLYSEGRFGCNNL